jgi:uncharacterized protein (DUF58 family)
MDRHELLQRIRTFPITAKLLAEDLRAGNFKSMFSGQGIEADEVRRYELGDDIRSIDWNVSARFGTPYVKMYREEREMTVSVVLDCSASMFAAQAPSAPLNRYEQGLLTAAMIAFSAEEAGLRTGAVFFDQRVFRVYPPRRGRSHIMAVIGDALGIQGGGKGSDLGAAIEGLDRLLKRRGFAVIISDFQSVNWEQKLGDLCRRHDVLVIRIRDPLDRELIDAGLLFLEDPETGVRYHAPTGSAAFRSAWAEWHENRLNSCRSICHRTGASFLDIATNDDVLAALIRFFDKRGVGG